MRYIFGGHLAEVSFTELNLTIFLNLKSLHVTSHCLSLAQAAKSNLNQLLRVHTAMIVSSGCDGSWHDNTSREDSLEDTRQVYPSRQFLDQQWCETLGPEFFRDTQIVNLGHLYIGFINFDLGWCS